MKSLYIHIPFCRRKCIYCDFYSSRYSHDLASEYINTICSQILAMEDYYDTLYIGGGTPTVLDMLQWTKLLNALQPIVKNVLEFTVEANPESLDKDKLRLFINKGVTRISLGAQSFSVKKIKRLERIHSVEMVYNAIAMAEDHGFNNLGVDLIFGIWDELKEDWQDELAKVVNLPIVHISCYMLTYEEGTPIYAQREIGQVSPLTEDDVACMYRLAMDYLPRYGFEQYEISNYARKGYQCKHNLNYWENNTYVGLGPSAVSHINGIRERNVSDIAQYIARIQTGQSPVVFREQLSLLQRAKETAALGIRRKEGISFTTFFQKTGFDFIELQKTVLPKLLRDGLIEYNIINGEKCGINLTPKGFLFCDTVSAELL